MLREFTVRPVLNGYIVHIGCQTVVFESRQGLISAITEYLKEPEVVESRWLKHALNAGELGPSLYEQPNPETRP
jgi:hypothetical protein